MLTLRKHRLAFLLLALIATVGVIAPLFLIAGCRTLQQTPQELKARDTLRSMTRGGVLPAEDAVARIESDFPKTTAGALAKIVHARIKLNATDFTGAAALLDSSTIRDYTVISDYALWLRAGALEQANRRPEARAAYEQLARDFPTSLRARDAMLHDAQILMQDGQVATVTFCCGKRAQVPGSRRRFEWFASADWRSTRRSFVQSGAGLWPRETVGTGAQHV